MKKFFVASIVLTLSGIGAAHAVTNDVLTWMDSQLPANQFIGYRGQLLRDPSKLDANGNPMVCFTPGVGTCAWQLVGLVEGLTDLLGLQVDTYQPFRSKVDATTQKVYFRKDDFRDLSHSWYGEIWYYDANQIYLHSETYPAANKAETRYSWDQRPDRFRIFKDKTAANVNKYSSYVGGRVIAPRTVSSTWSWSGYLDTFVCGIYPVAGLPAAPVDGNASPEVLDNKLVADNFSSPTGAGPASYQRWDGFFQGGWNVCAAEAYNIPDASVTVEIRNNFNFHAVSTGMVAANANRTPYTGSTKVAAAPTTWDSVMIINQVRGTYSPTLGQGYVRERFIFGYHQGVYYGQVGWDQGFSSSSNPADQSAFVITDTATPEVILQRTTGAFDFNGMVIRGQKDRTLPPPTAPVNLNVQCIANSSKALLSWNAIPGQTATALGINDQIDGWFSAANDISITHSGDSYIFDTKSGHVYDWTVIGKNEAGTGQATGSASTFGSCSGLAPTVVPAVPAQPTVQMVGDVAILSWPPVAGATSYDIRIDNQTMDPWYTPANDFIIDGHLGASYVFKLPRPNDTYNVWVHARNAFGGSAASVGKTFTYTAPTQANP